VAIGADCRVILVRKLARMWFGVACLTILGCSLELDFVRTGGHFMTFAAGHAPVRPFERELGFRMVESAHIGPGAHVMAGFTSQRGAIRAQRRHALLEFPTVGVLMAGGASTVLEMERQHLVGPPAQTHLVTIRARHRDVSSRKHEPGFAVHGDGIVRSVEIFDGVAFLTPILVGRSGKLPVVDVLVAIGTRFEFDPIDRVLPSGEVAFGTLHLYVLALERILRAGVFFHAERGRLEPIHRVARGAFALVRSRAKLALVRIWSVTIHALRERNLLLEVSACMAILAADRHVFAQQRIFGLGMIERRGHPYRIPAARRVASVAGLREAAPMRIFVTIRARAEGQPGELRGASGPAGGMALFASDFDVQAGQRVPRLGMIKPRSCFPVGEVVALGAIRAQPAAVRVLVAGNAVLRQA